MSDHLSLASEHMTDAFIVVRSDSSLRMALAELEKRGGQEWWFLVVLTGEPAKVLATSFQSLRHPLEEDETLLDRPLSEVGYPLEQVEYVEAETNLSDAYARAVVNRQGIVLIVDNPELLDSGSSAAKHIRGVIHSSTRQAMATPGAGSLFDLLSRAVLPAVPPVPKMEPSQRASDLPRAKPPEPSRLKGEVGDRSDRFVGAEPEESMLEESPQPRPTSAVPDDREKEETAEEINVSVGGSVSAGGTITVAGRDIIYNLLPPEMQTKEQDRRFEVAFPREAHRDESYDLWVVVALPDAPPFFADDQEANIVEEKPEAAVSVEFEVDRTTGALKPAEVEVQVTGDGFEIVGAKSRLLTVYPDGTPDKRRFLVKALETGKQRLLVEFMQDGRLLKEMTIVAEVFAPETKPAGALNLSFQVAIFGVTLSFATGGAA